MRFVPLNSFLSNNLGLSDISGTVSWDTDDLDANGDGSLSVPSIASLTSSLDGFEDDLAGMDVSIENGALASIGAWQFQIGCDFFFVALTDLNSNEPQWFAIRGDGQAESILLQNWRLVSLQSVPEPGSIGLLSIGLLAFGLAGRRKRFHGQISLTR